MNRNRFAEPTSVRIGIGIVREFQNLRIGIGIIFVRWEVFANNSRIPDIFFSLKKLSKIFFVDSYIFFIWKIYPANKSIVRYMHTLYIYWIRIRYSWILWKIFVNRNIICQIKIFVNRNNIHEMKLWRIGIGIYSWPKYQRIDLWRIYSQTIRELFANRELFAEHWCGAVRCGAVRRGAVRCRAVRCFVLYRFY